QERLLRLPGGVGPDVLAGRAVEGQAAAAEQLVEAGQPAEPAAVGEVDVLGVDGPLDGGAPAQRQAVVVAAPQPHAAGGQDGVGEGAVVDLDEVDAVAQAAAE